MVENYTEHPKTLGGRQRLDWLRERQALAREDWDKNGAPDPEEALRLVKERTANQGSFPL